MAHRLTYEDLYREVIAPGYCTACGTCAGVCPSGGIVMTDQVGDPEPAQVGNCTGCGMCLAVCPGREVPLRDLDRMVFGRERNWQTDHLGLFLTCLRGQATDTTVLDGSASGGMVPALLIDAIEQGSIDCALVAGWDKSRPWRCAPVMADTVEKVRAAARTALVIVPTNAALREAIMEKKYGRVGVVGLPCHVHGLRKLQMNLPRSRAARSIQFILGLFCAGACYYRGLEHLLLETGAVSSLDEIVALDWRAGDWPGSLMVLTREGKMQFVASKHDYAWHFLQSATFKRERCTVCVDWSSELADVAFGDVFQPLEGTNRWSATLVRTRKGQELVEGAVARGRIRLVPHNPTLLPASGLGFESKKHACVHRLLERRRHGGMAPDYQYELSVEPLPRRLSFPK